MVDDDAWLDAWVEITHIDGPIRVENCSSTDPLPPSFPLGFAPAAKYLHPRVPVEPLLWDGDQA
ncbi:hypothetical protein GCM10022215_24290 [Nocardioides fonticola]|uniref:Uncharacterized protein n=1 Tax=Nocardioides fonticola TaxID=450363 RepID=A0ABP7XJU7_9ACTN